MTSIEDEENCAWNSDTNEFVLKLRKLNENEHFEGLDLISRLLTVRTEDELKKNGNLIEVIDQSEDQSTDDQADPFDESFALNEYEQANRSLLDTKHAYGFLNRHSGLLEKYQDELWQLADLKNPGELSIEERRAERLKKETADFDEEYYLFDQYENNKLIDGLRLAKSSWLDGLKSTNGSDGSTDGSNGRRLVEESDKQPSDSSSNGLTDDEIFRLKNLPRKEFKLSKDEKLLVLYGLVDMLFAYCYDKRINEGNLKSSTIIFSPKRSLAS